MSAKPTSKTIIAEPSAAPVAIVPTLSDIRKSCDFVTTHAKHVHLNSKNLSHFAKSIVSPPEHWLATNPHNLLSLPLPLLTTTLLYFEVIDYSFWPGPPATPCAPKPDLLTITQPPTLEPAPPAQKSAQKWTIPSPDGPLDGSTALLYLLLTKARKHLAKTQSHPTAPFNFAEFSDVDFHHFFHPAGTIGKIPLLAERSQALRETSRILRNQLNNDFFAAIKIFTSDEQLFHFLITTFPSLRDQRTYPPVSKADRHTSTNKAACQPQTIHFYKLAQLLSSDLLFVRHHLEHIKVDAQNLPGCADYKIPQTLRALNLISYSPELSDLVDTKRLIPENSHLEVEIRAATISAISFLHHVRPDLSPIQINDHLFLNSRQLINPQPYHLTRTTNY